MKQRGKEKDTEKRRIRQRKEAERQKPEDRNKETDTGEKQGPKEAEIEQATEVQEWGEDVIECLKEQILEPNFEKHQADRGGRYKIGVF